MAKSVSKSATTPKKKGAKIAVVVPTHVADASACNRALSAFLDDIERYRAEADAKKAQIDANLERDTAALVEEAIKLAEQIYGFAEARRDELTDHGMTKTAPIGNAGTVVWATSPPAVSIEDPEAVLRRIRILGLQGFIRTRPDEINRDAMLDDPKSAGAIEGVTIASAEKVYVRPAAARARVEATLGKRGKPGKWKIVWPKDEVSQ